MSILSGYKRFKDYIKTDNGYILTSRRTTSDAVVMGDGTDDTDTLESRLGGITGITSDLNCKDEGMVASMSLINRLGNWLPKITLPAGETTITIEDDIITSNSIIDIYYSDRNISVSEVQDNTSLTITLDSALSNDLEIYCKVVNIID